MKKALRASPRSSSPSRSSLPVAATTGNDGTSDTTSVNHNQQDITFATDMIPHHLQAAQMAKMAQTKRPCLP